MALPVKTGERSGLRRKMWVAFIMQLAAISFATVVGVFGASVVIKHLLIQRALHDEAAHFWQRYQDDPTIEVPDTFNMTGYMVGGDGDQTHLPESLRQLSPGYHSLPRAQGGSLVLVDPRPEGTLLLVFKQDQVDALAFWFGMVPLALVLAVIYLIAWFTYRLSHRAVSPLIWLANLVKRWDPNRPDVGPLKPENLPLDVEGESLVLASSLYDFVSRLEQFVERERNFTRDASHELRTPITVIRMACEMMQADPEIPSSSRRSLARIQSAVRDMESLVQAFLILAREGDTGLPDEDFLVNDVVHDEMEKARFLLADKPVELVLDEAGEFELHAPRRVLSVMLGNLLRNACLYTERGEVRVRVRTGELRVEDTGIGMESTQLAQVFEPFYRGESERLRGSDGHGIGLSIVARLSQRFGWPVTMDSTPGAGTRVTVRFPAVGGANRTA